MAKVHGPDPAAIVEGVLEDFVASARSVFGPTLRSAVLFGSAAEGRLRATSDVNLILVLERFERAEADRLREPLRTAQAAVRLTVMFLLESEVAAALDAFAVKFCDVRRRHRVLFGPDPFAHADVPRDAVIDGLKRTLLNLEIRLREAYVLRSLREEQIALVIADAAGPLRAAAAAILELEGAPAPSPREALERLARELFGEGASRLLSGLSTARETRHLAPDADGAAVFDIMLLARGLGERAARLPA